MIHTGAKFREKMTPGPLLNSNVVFSPAVRPCVLAEESKASEITCVGRLEITIEMFDIQQYIVIDKHYKLLLMRLHAVIGEISIASHCFVGKIVVFIDELSNDHVPVLFHFFLNGFFDDRIFRGLSFSEQKAHLRKILNFGRVFVEFLKSAEEISTLNIRSETFT